MSINALPGTERPREKLQSCGPRCLSDAELLAIVLGSGNARQSAIETSRALLAEYGGLRSVLNQPVAHLQACRGIGGARAARLVACAELGRRYFLERARRMPCLNSPKEVREYLIYELRDRREEVFAAILLDNRHRIIAFEELFRGTVNCAQVHPRVVAWRALNVNAAAVIAAHNHPSGVAEPSEADRNLTDRLSRALALFDIRLLDHFIIGDGEAVSLSERGLM